MFAVPAVRRDLAGSLYASAFPVISPRCARRGKQSVHFRVYLVAVRSPWAAKRAFSRLSCRGALVGASQVCLLAFVLSRFYCRCNQRMHFRVCLFHWCGACSATLLLLRFLFYLVAVRSSCGPSQVISPFYLLTCTHSEASFSKMMQVFIIIKNDV